MSQYQFMNRKNDEYQTPIYAINPILEFIKPNSRILCPFDENDSNYVKVLTNEGHTVINSHIMYGQDFFKMNVKSHFDYIISNPPYSKKKEIFAKLFEIDIPFALLLNAQGLFDSKKAFELFKDKIDHTQIMYLYPRVCYIKDGVQTTGNIFPSAYLCYKFLPKQLILKQVFLTLNERRYRNGQTLSNTWDSYITRLH